MGSHDNRKVLLGCALEMIAERGLSGVSTWELAHQAEVSEALIFHHFGTKAALVIAAAKSGNTLLASIEQLTSAPPSTDIGALVDQITAIAEERQAHS